MKTKLAFCLLLAILLSACGPGQFLGPTLTPPPTLTYTPTLTSTPTLTPTITPTPTVTFTPTPTFTATPFPLPPAIAEYFKEMDEINAHRAAGLLTDSLLPKVLQAIQPPTEFGATHEALAQAAQELDQARNASYSALLEDLNCVAKNFSANWSVICAALSKKATQLGVVTADAERKFDKLWKQAEKEREDYRRPLGYLPFQTATPFPVQPKVTPIAIGDPGTGHFGIEITALEVNLDAWPVIQDHDPDNDPPSSMTKYVLVKVKVANQGNKPVWISAGQFSLNNGNSQNKEARLNNPDDFVDQELWPGEEITGSLSFELYAKAKGTLLMLFLKGDVVIALAP